MGGMAEGGDDGWAGIAEGGNDGWAGMTGGRGWRVGRNGGRAGMTEE